MNIHNFVSRAEQLPLLIHSASALHAGTHLYITPKLYTVKNYPYGKMTTIKINYKFAR
jgi:hypothetical protein